MNAELETSANYMVWHNKWRDWARYKQIVGNCQDYKIHPDTIYRPDDTILREEASIMPHIAFRLAIPE